jgi:AbrB family looped-hinge helix DNA binding protein
MNASSRFAYIRVHSRFQSSLPGHTLRHTDKSNQNRRMGGFDIERRGKKVRHMTTTLSTKGQIVLPRAARERLGLTPGTEFDCRIEDEAIVLRPRRAASGAPRLARDKRTGLIVTKAPAGRPKVTSEQVRALLADFP